MNAKKDFNENQQKAIKFEYQTNNNLLHALIDFRCNNVITKVCYFVLIIFLPCQKLFLFI